MSKPTVNRSSRKPSQAFPLYRHKLGYWAKKVKGRCRYFGRIAGDETGQQALARWLEQKDDLLAGREPRPKQPEGVTVRDLCNRFLSAKEQMRDDGELNSRTFATYHGACRVLCEDAKWRDRQVVDLQPDDFRQLRGKMAKTRKAVALSNEITRIRAVFKFGFEEGIITTPIRFGQAFTRPRKEVIDKQRQANRMTNGLRMLEAEELRRVIAEARQPLKAMVLLAANTGFGNTDVGALPVKAVNLETGWVDFPRVKNATPRRVPLWPETVEAIRDWLAVRPKAKNAEDAGLMFLTHTRQRWVKVNEKGQPADQLGGEFCKLLGRLGLKRKGLSFYCLRHGFETVAGDTGDQVAVDAVMGHTSHGMAALYRERISDERLRRVVDSVRTWLYSSEATDAVN